MMLPIFSERNVLNLQGHCLSVLNYYTGFPVNTTLELLGINWQWLTPIKIAILFCGYFTQFLKRKILCLTKPQAIQTLSKLSAIILT